MIVGGMAFLATAAVRREGPLALLVRSANALRRVGYITGPCLRVMWKEARAQWYWAGVRTGENRRWDGEVVSIEKGRR